MNLYDQWRDARASAEAANPTDDETKPNIPMAVSLGSAVHLPKMPFVRAVGVGALMPVIDDTRPRVESIEEVQLPSGGLLYRFQLDSYGDDPSGTYVQVRVGDDGAVQEALYARPLVGFKPKTQDEIAAFTGTIEAGLGERIYALLRSDLEELGFTSSVLRGVMDNLDSIEYVRDSQSEEPYLSPLRCVGRRLHSTRGPLGYDRDIWMVPYVRDLGGRREYLIVSAWSNRDDDAKSVDQVIHVQLDLAMPLEAERWSVT